MGLTNVNAMGWGTPYGNTPSLVKILENTPSFDGNRLLLCGILKS